MLRLSYMDTTTVAPTDQSVPTQNPPVQPVAQQPVSSIGGSKEHAPVPARTEYVSPAPVETIPQISQELKDLGIEESPDTHKPDVPPDVRQMGVTPVKTATPVTLTPQDQVTLPTPVSYQQAVSNLKSHKADESISWLSMLSKYVLERLGMQRAA